MSLRNLLSGVLAPRPPEIHMPSVSEPADLREIVVRARAMLACAERKVAILMPDRDVMLVPTPPPGSMKEELVAPLRRMFPVVGLNVTVVSLTAVNVAEKDNTRRIQDTSRCIPLLGNLIGLAYSGQNVLVFEGHPSAFETVVRGSDVLLIDSGMLPFLQADWFETARRAMPAGRMLYFDRQRHNVLPLVKSKNAPGWRKGEPDGEGSYLNCLLTTLAKLPPTPVEMVAGQPVPDLRLLASGPEEREWAAELPFQYDALDSAEVVRLMQLVSKWEAPVAPASKTFRAKLAADGGLKDVCFELSLSEHGAGNVGLKILRK